MKNHIFSKVSQFKVVMKCFTVYKKIYSIKVNLHTFFRDNLHKILRIKFIFNIVYTELVVGHRSNKIIIQILTKQIRIL